MRDSTAPYSGNPGWSRPRPSPRGRILTEGLMGGLVGYVSVALVLGALDLLRGRSIFHTAAAVGGALFYGEAAAPGAGSALGPVLAYNGVHLLGSVALGLVAAFQVFETERHRSVWYFSLMLAVATCVYSIAIFGVLGVEAASVLDWPTVVVGGVVWAGSMASYFTRVHRRLWQGIRMDIED